MNVFSRKPAHAVPNWGKRPPAPENRPAIEEPRGGGCRWRVEINETKQQATQQTHLPKKSFHRVSHGTSFLAPGSLARRRLARVIHHHQKSSRVPEIKTPTGGVIVSAIVLSPASTLHCSFVLSSRLHCCGFPRSSRTSILLSGFRRPRRRRPRCRHRAS